MTWTTIRKVPEFWAVLLTYTAKNKVAPVWGLTLVASARREVRTIFFNAIFPAISLFLFSPTFLQHIKHRPRNFLKIPEWRNYNRPLPDSQICSNQGKITFLRWLRAGSITSVLSIQSPTRVVAEVPVLQGCGGVKDNALVFLAPITTSVHGRGNYSWSGAFNITRSAQRISEVRPVARVFRLWADKALYKNESRDDYVNSWERLHRPIFSDEGDLT